jgi:ubiquinone/menaquinone biosynthesis C-methylase UbiE
MTWQGTHKRRTFKNVKAFWEQSGRIKPSDPRITIRDHYFRLLEIDTIKKYLKKKDVVLDIGCGNGYSTMHYSQKVKSIIGADYSENLIKGSAIVRKTFLKEGGCRRDNVNFRVADVLSLPFINDIFDKVIGERLLINLPRWSLQRDAIKEIHRVLSKGGLYLCVEVTEEGHNKVNYYRDMLGLPKLERYWHNCYVKESKFLSFIKKYFTVIEIKRFGMYQFLTKIVYPFSIYPKSPDFLSDFNKAAMEIGKKITNFNDCSHQVMFILKKK